jgi:hypothetical protein
MMKTDEPSVLDYVKAKLLPWRGPAPEIPLTREESRPAAAEAAGPPAHLEIRDTGPASARKSAAAVLPWLVLAGFGLALAAQISLEPRVNRSWEVGAFLYLLSFAGLTAAVWRGQIEMAPVPEQEQRTDPLTVRTGSLWVGLALGLAAFLLMGGNRFSSLNVILWIAAIYFVIQAFWLDDPHQKSWFSRAVSYLQQPHWRISLSRWSLLILASTLLILFFRLHMLEQVPPQMVSDHAEKLLDVWDVIQGETRIFFPRNTGREGLQMYMTAAAARYLGTGFSFLSLKIGTVLVGLLTLPFIYLLGKEIANARVGLLAMTLAGMAYWPNVIARSGLRFPLYPLFVAPALYYLLRGIRRSNRNDFILSGLFLGIGLHGYTPIRILPLVILIAVGLYLLHRSSAGRRRQTVWSLIVLAFVSLMVFLPLIRYSFSDPELFGYRAFSRLGTVERPLPDSPLVIFAGNLWNAMTMFAWDNGQIWPVSVTHRPALDLVSGALFHAGVGLLLLRFLRRRSWLDFFLLLAVPLLMLPSILSLAFPAENPAPNRAGGAIVPVFLIAALALDSLMESLKKRLGSQVGPRAAWGLAVLLLAWSASQNYDLVFRQYRVAYERLAWNTNEMGQVIRSYAESVGSLDTAWVVAFPHWADTRLVGMHAGNPTRDYAVFPEGLPDTVPISGPKLFIVNRDDVEGIEILQALYPVGWFESFKSRYETRDFLMFMVPRQVWQP